MEILPESLLSTSDVEDAVISSERGKELIKAINMLSDSDQLLLSLRYFAELPYKILQGLWTYQLPQLKPECQDPCKSLKNLWAKGVISMKGNIDKELRAMKNHLPVNKEYLDTLHKNLQKDIFLRKDKWRIRKSYPILRVGLITACFLIISALTFW